ncbi:hypothetical protein CN321_01360 [Bacillus thuringiensis]|uniref:hypothetical protein n=1 Tax=Bacillus thuringiensis TaxID=1428 RepID=UPI000BF84BF6|nr:hypothetical protein [Bacillus thuringiensis]PFA83982.1 hypothetical protein CN400_16360 [Bacillus thuringiensis]PFF00514.1 hypothetical protein CN321_01360 [Bacillus thuringiensis]
MELLKCDNCEKEMTHNDRYYEMKFHVERFCGQITHNETYYNFINGGPPVYHFCNKECVLEWAQK